jgi:hypothetical protein
LVLVVQVVPLTVLLVLLVVLPYSLAIPFLVVVVVV